MHGTTPEFTDVHRQILDFERAWWKHQGAKLEAVRTRFGMSSTRYYQVLDWIIDQPAALIYDAQMVHRLSRLRAQREQSRTARRDGFDLAAS